MQYRLSLLAFFWAIFWGVAQDVDSAEVKTAFETAKIPSSLGINFNPFSVLQLSLPQTDGSSLAVKAGTKVARASTAIPPKFILKNISFTGLFVVVMVDLDAPSPGSPTASPIRHYLGGGWTADGLATGVLSNTSIPITDWRQPSPPSVEPHRYVYLLYIQSGQFESQKLVTPETPITNWNLTSFTQQVGLGDPLAGTFILVGADA